MTKPSKAIATIELQYNGYPEDCADDVVKNNITGDEDWKEYVTSNVTDACDGIAKCTAVTLGTPYSPLCDDGFVCLRVPLLLELELDKVEGVDEAGERIENWCDVNVDSEVTFFSDQAWLDEIVKE